MLIEPTSDGLFCAAGGFHIDPWQPVARAVITHAHGDHLRPGSHSYLCAAPALSVVRRRLPPEAHVAGLPFGETVVVDGVSVSFHPAGHVLGSAQVRVEQAGEVWVASGDYKLAADPTCAPFEPVRCHTFITEATFGLPVFRWQPADAVVDDIMMWWDEMQRAGRPAVLFAYALGKTQRILAELGRRTDRYVFVHGALAGLIDVYRAAGVSMPPTRVATDEPRGTSFAGQLILAPVLARGSVWMRRFAEHSSAFASGWMRIRGARRRRGYDRGFVLSDHADWPSLLQAVAASRAERVFVTHGYTAPLARYLASRGFDARPWETRYEGEPETEAAD
jgi:putative mRNA 3-end processing factor